VKIYKYPGKTTHWIATLAIGKEYFSNWEANALPTWKVFAEKYDVGIAVFDSDLISRDSSNWKKANWHKLLIGQKMAEAGFQDSSVLLGHSNQRRLRTREIKLNYRIFCIGACIC
jgi:hypothetical protein